MTASGLETPSAPDDLYLARVDEVEVLKDRPIFTGDVVRTSDEHLFCVLQHPCAFRQGTKLAKRVLVSEVFQVDSSPVDWSVGHFKSMFLPELGGAGTSTWKVAFSEICILSLDELRSGERIAILSGLGVNLLLQRWLHHNSRVVVPTARLAESTSGPFDEADLIADSISDLVAGGMLPSAALQWVETWFGEQYLASGGSRRDALNDRQSVAGVRASLRKAVSAESAQLD